MAAPKKHFIDLFAGTGAFSYVLEQKGWHCALANDLMPSSQKIYELNHAPGVFKLGDLNKIRTKKIPAHQLLCAGFPCQPFSIAGERKGFDDQRANVFWKILKILKKHKPPVIILENVKNLKSHDHGNTYQVISQRLRKLGYHLKDQILDTSKITSIPQHRERIYIVGFLKKEWADRFVFDFPKIKNQSISELLENHVPEKYYYTNKLKVYEKVAESVTKDVRTENTLYQYRRYYVRENKSNVCPTLTANMGGGGHNVPLLKDEKGIRKLTPRECFNLQGFPATFQLPDLSDSALYKLAGNAVSVPVVELIVNKILKIYE